MNHASNRYFTVVLVYAFTTPLLPNPNALVQYACLTFSLTLIVVLHMFIVTSIFRKVTYTHGLYVDKETGDFLRMPEAALIIYRNKALDFMKRQLLVDLLRLFLATLVGTFVINLGVGV